MEKGEPSCTVVVYGAATQKTVWKFLKELKIELPYNPAIALLGIYPKDTDAVKNQDNSSNVHNSQTVEGASVSIER